MKTITIYDLLSFAEEPSVLAWGDSEGGLQIEIFRRVKSYAFFIARGSDILARFRKKRLEIFVNDLKVQSRTTVHKFVVFIGYSVFHIGSGTLIRRPLSCSSISPKYDTK